MLQEELRKPLMYRARRYCGPVECLPYKVSGMRRGCAPVGLRKKRETSLCCVPLSRARRTRCRRRGKLAPALRLASYHIVCRLSIFGRFLTMKLTNPEREVSPE